MLYNNELKFLKPSLCSTGPKKETKTSTMQSQKKRSEKNLISYWTNFCMRSAVHGMRYLGDTDIKPFERIIWSFIVTIAVVFTIIVSTNLHKRFKSENIEIIVESTIYPIYKIPFPTIIICNYNRVNWDRIGLAEKQFLPPNPSENTKKIFRRIALGLANFGFGHFGEFKEIDEDDLKLFKFLNLTAVAELLAFNCDEMFEGDCWWFDQFYSCCDIFAKTKSEYGFCQTFNSMVVSTKIRENNEPLWPLRGPKAGVNTGLRVTVKLNTLKSPPGFKEIPGIFVTPTRPSQWSSHTFFIKNGTETSLSMRPKYSYATNDTKSIPIEVRECLFVFEKSVKLESLPGLPYMLGNCISQCHQRYLIEFCGCTIEMFFPIGNFTPCSVSDLPCLFPHEKIFQREVQPNEEMFVQHLSEGMECRCFHECDLVDYMPDIYPYPLDDGNEHHVILDVHYEHSYMYKYRTHLQFGWMDLMVSFGGIASLFLGCSLISGVEIIYYIVGPFFHFARKFFTRMKGKRNFTKKAKGVKNVFVIARSPIHQKEFNC